MTLGELKSQVRALMAYELESERFSDANLLTYVHHALRDFALQAWWRFVLSSRNAPVPAGTASLDFADHTQFTPPLLQVRRVWWDTWELDMLKHRDISYHLASLGMPKYMIVEGARVQLYPMPSAEGIILGWGIRMPILPQNDNDVIDFPAGYSVYLPHGVVWQMAFLSGVQNSPNVQRSLQVWQAGIAMYKTNHVAEYLRDEASVSR